MYKEYFNEIFQNTKTVILPGIGSFTKPNPVENTIVFNPFLKFNDGFLIGFISRKQGISMDEAGKQVNDNVARINEALDKNGEAIIVGLGTLKKSADGKVEFISNMNITDGASAVKTEIPKAVAPEVKIPEVKKEEIKQPEVKKETPKQPEVKAPEPKKEEPKQETPKAIIPPVVPVNKVEIPEIKNPEAPVVPTAAEVKADAKKAKEKIKKEKPVKVKKEGKKKRFPIVLVLVILLLGGAGTFAAMKWDMVKGWIGMGGETKTEEKKIAEVKKEDTKVEPKMADTSAVAPDTAAVVEEVVEEPVVVEEAVKEEPIKSEPVKNTPVVSSNGNFHVIVNCFTVEENASKMVSILSTKGHAGQNLGQRGGYFMVSAGSFSSREEALSKLSQIKSEYPKAWLYEGM